MDSRLNSICPFCIRDDMYKLENFSCLCPLKTCEIDLYIRDDITRSVIECRRFVNANERS